MRSNLLVTGGAGFIGANFIRYWLNAHANDRLIALDALTYAGRRINLPDESTHFRFVHGDIRDEALVTELLRAESITTIVHFAAESHVDRSITGPDEFISTNVVGTHSLLKCARRVWRDGAGQDVHRFHHVSTDEVYGSLGPSDSPFTETTQYAPNSPYAASKAASDHLVRAYAHTYGLNVTISNCSNNYGPYQFPEKLIPLMLINALHGKPLPVYGDGTNIRDWLYVEDHCRAIDLVLSRGADGDTYNIGGGNERRNIDVVQGLCAAIDKRFTSSSDLRRRFPDCPASTGESCGQLIQFVTDRPGHDWRYAIDHSKISRELGFRPQSGWDNALAATLDWYVANEDWWRALL